MDPSSKLHGQPLAGRFASNGTFWSMLYGLSGKRPEWFAEVAARWLDRQVVRALATQVDGHLPSAQMDDFIWRRRCI
jgi:hypothetical protein